MTLDVTGDDYAPWWNHDLVVFDVETTGLNADAGDRIVEVGFARFKRGRLVETWGSLVNPQRLIPEKASAIHGIHQADVATAPPFSGIVGKALRISRNAWPVAYNATFDAKFWRMEMRRIGLDALQTPIAKPDHPWLDPLVWVRQANGIWGGNKLNQACERYGVTLTNAHRATDDATAAGRLLFEALRDVLPPVTMHEIIHRQRHYHAKHEEERSAWFRKKGLPYR